jgi:hypothetical protein
VVLPVLALIVGALGRLGRLLSPLVKAEGEIPKDVPDLALVGLQNLVQRFITETLAEWSLVVAELDDGDRRVFGPDEWVIVGADLHHYWRRCRLNRHSGLHSRAGLTDHRLAIILILVRELENESNHGQDHGQHRQQIG